MRILVLLAGIADTKWPLASLNGSATEVRARQRIILGPFDEAALEVGLKLRDGHFGVTVSAALVGGPECDDCAHRAAALKPDHLTRLELPDAPLWDAVAWAEQLAEAVANIDGAPDPDLILMGREFGDFDAGALPAVLARVLERPFFGLAQYALWTDGTAQLVRERGSREETLKLAGTPVLASVTNDRRNRLRHPLMKNVMEAKRAKIPVVESPAPSRARVGFVRLGETVPPIREGSCRRLGGPVEAQVTALADYLQPWSHQA